LFGKKLAKSGSKYNSVDIINIIVKLMLGDFITDWTSTNVAVDPRTVETFSDAVSTEATPFLQGEVSDADEYNLPLQGFLHSNNLFGELTYITRPHTEEELSEYFVTSAKTDTNFKTALSYFEEFFRTDDEFLTAVLNGMQVRLDRKYTVKDMLRTNLISSSPYLVDYLRTLNPASVQYSNLLAQIITNEMVTGESFRS
jgi:hypothetical protein